jgi:hypothetical protein
MALAKEILVARKAFGGVLDHLGGGQVGDDHGPLQRSVELEQGHGHLLGGGADDDAVGAERVLDGRSLAEELGVRDHVEGDGPGLVALDHLAHELAGPHRHRGLVHHHEVGPWLPDGAGHGFHGAEAVLPPRPEGCPR